MHINHIESILLAGENEECRQFLLEQLYRQAFGWQTNPLGYAKKMQLKNEEAALENQVAQTLKAVTELVEDCQMKLEEKSETIKNLQDLNDDLTDKLGCSKMIISSCSYKSNMPKR